MSLSILVQYSHRYGKNPEFVLAGGGNTSYKTDDILYIKGSGTSLSTIQEEEFVKIDRPSLAKIWDKTYSNCEKEREAQVLADMMAARLPGEEAKRPSVETLLHNLFPQKFILHVHPAAVNGITCSQNGEKTVNELFPDAIWIAASKPGYILASICKEAIDQYKQAHSEKAPGVLFLENHGIFFAADSEEELDKTVSDVMTKIDQKLLRKPDFSAVEFDEDKATAIAPELRMLYANGEKAIVTFTANKEILNFAKDENAFSPLVKSFTPDHIVYCKSSILFIKKTDTEKEIQEQFVSFKNENGYAPKIIFVEGLGMFACGKDKKEADVAKTVFIDALKIAVYAESFGGVKPMPDMLIDFINNWEAESYRQKISFKAGQQKRLLGKVSVITGSAQGFGRGIAEKMIQEGAYIVVADINEQGAQSFADELNTKYGNGSAVPVAGNVCDEADVKKLMNTAVLAYGGIDIYVNNAGIVRAGSLEEMQMKDFNLVTNVNYTAYFLCVKYATVSMKIQHKYNPDYFMDIIQINSKSGLSGSNKNFAYAGSKFGGIGLTQSFALELVPYNIKVNAICPGNFLNGPLWSDPEKGLFVQYLNAGKVPGAKTVDDVRKFYESKVPLNRGCEIMDVARAIFYVVEQEYETGQAIPVTGGQAMLK